MTPSYKLLVVSESYPRQGDPNAGIFLHRQNRELLRRDCDILVVSPLPILPRILEHEKHYLRYQQQQSQSKIDGINVRYTRVPSAPGIMLGTLSAFFMVRPLKAILREHLKGSNRAVLQVNMATPFGVAGLVIQRQLGIPLVICLRGSDVHTYPHSNPITYQATRQVIARANQVTAVSDNLRSEAEKIAGRANDIHVVYTGCDPEKFKFDEAKRRAIRSQLGIEPSECLLVFVGHLKREKGLNELVEAYEHASRIIEGMHLVIIGSGKINEITSLSNVVENQPELASRIHLVGSRPHQEIPAWLAASDIMVLPSWNEGLPNSLIEAMSCGRPVIASKVGGIPEAVQDGYTGLLHPKGDVEAIVGAILELAADPNRRMEMGIAGRETARQRFSWSANASTMIKIYQDALERR